MLIATGIFENERFIPDTPISIPQKRKVVVTIEEDTSMEVKPEMTWRQLCEAIHDCTEELPGEPQPVTFRTIEEMELL